MEGNADWGEGASWAVGKDEMISYWCILEVGCLWLWGHLHLPLLVGLRSWGGGFGWNCVRWVKLLTLMPFLLLPLGTGV